MVKSIGKENIHTLYIWSGCEITILTTKIYNTTKYGYVIKQRDDHDDVTDDTKIYSRKEIEDYIDKIRDEKKFFFVDNAIETSCQFMNKFKSVKEMFENRRKCY